jgi:chemotaxis protein CheX
MNIEVQDIRDITGSVWSSVLGAQPEGRGDEEARLSGAVWTGCVQMAGGWDGAVTVQCPAHLVRGAAASMFDVDPLDISADEMRDALGELANMIGGNIKALLPGPTQLSLPFVVEGDKDALKIQDVVAVHRVWFHSFGETFAVTLLAKSAAPQRRRSGLPQSPLGGERSEDPHRR